MGHMIRDFIRMVLPLLVVGGGLSALGAMLYGVWQLGRYYGRDESLRIDIADIQARLHRVEQAVTQNTHAVDRLEMAQRISTRLRGEVDGLDRLPSRQVTPH